MFQRIGTSRLRKNHSNPKIPQNLDLTRFYPARTNQVRKGDFGRVVIAGGSLRYAGCLAFNALSALRAGADLSIVVAPRRAADIVAGYSPDLITAPCDSPFPDPKIVEKMLDGADALVIGCGVERTRKAHKALVSIIEKCQTPIVADAETLHALAPMPGIGRGKQMLMTPNAGEYRTLSGAAWPESQQKRESAVKALAKRYRSTVIVKGALDFISDGDRVAIDREGSPYLTKGGYGDIFAGAAGALLARDHTAFEAARVAAYLTGRAGKMAAQKYGEGTLASDALVLLPAIIREGVNTSTRIGTSFGLAPIRETQRP
jgi:NAD(P)H-hydrate epimerase